jgi:hypothetical protein
MHAQARSSPERVRMAARGAIFASLQRKTSSSRLERIAAAIAGMRLAVGRDWFLQGVYCE